MYFPVVGGFRPPIALRALIERDRCLGDVMLAGFRKSEGQ